MFAITPFDAEREELKSNKSGGMTFTWQPCRVVGVATNADGDLEYVVEVRDATGRWTLERVGYVRRVCPAG